MKFTNGNWLVREGYQIHFPRIVHEVEERDGAVTLYAPCKYLNHRGGDTLDGPLLTIKISAPVDDVIRVQTWHFKGGKARYPQFGVLDQMKEIELEEKEDAVHFTSGGLQLSITKKDFSLSFKNAAGNLTDADGKGLAWIEGPEDKTYMRGQLRLGVGEHLYGLGERFTPFVKNGQSVDIWNKDGGTSSEQSYKNIPFYLSSKGYGIFVNHPEEVNFELGSETVSRSQFSVEGDS